MPEDQEENSLTAMDSAGPKWHLAELVVEFSFQNNPDRLVHINTHLIAARSAQTAYEKAVALGGSYEAEYLNTDGEIVRCRFVGLRNLFGIYDELEDGAELIYEELEGLSESEVAALVRPQNKLAAFSRQG